MTFKEKMFKEQPEIAAMTTWWCTHKKRIEKAHRKFMNDTKIEMDITEFVVRMYEQGKDLIEQPELN